MTAGDIHAALKIPLPFVNYDAFAGRVRDSIDGRGRDDQTGDTEAARGHSSPEDRAGRAPTGRTGTVS